MQENRRRTRRRIGSIRAFVGALLLTLTVAVGLGAAAAPAQAGTAPQTERSCTYGSSGGNVQTCLTLDGPGLRVKKGGASARVIGVGRVLKECVTGPGSTVDACGQPAYVGPGDTGQTWWNPTTRDVAPGKYHAKTYRRNPNGTFTLIGEATVTLS
jgi:hypothetical protein